MKKNLFLLTHLLVWFVCSLSLVKAQSGCGYAVPTMDYSAAQLETAGFLVNPANDALTLCGDSGNAGMVQLPSPTFLPEELPQYSYGVDVTAPDGTMSYFASSDGVLDMNDPTISVADGSTLDVTLYAYNQAELNSLLNTLQILCPNLTAGGLIPAVVIVDGVEVPTCDIVSSLAPATGGPGITDLESIVSLASVFGILVTNNLTALEALARLDAAASVLGGVCYGVSGWTDSATTAVYADPNYNIDQFWNGASLSFTYQAVCNDCAGEAFGPAIAGSQCNDGDPNTGNDMYDSECVCLGLPLDCELVPGGTALPGTSCSDNDPLTTNDTWNAECICIGELLPMDCEQVPGGSATVGTPCTHPDPNIINEVYDANCDCVGEIAVDCPELGLNIGASCDDGSAITTNDVVLSTCVCQGTLLPVDCNGIPGGPAIVGSACDDSNPNTIGDALNANCQCVGTATFDCPNLNANIGSACDDGDSNTAGDAVSANCVCVGTSIWDCPSINADFGSACNDGDANTINDMIQTNCTCAGTSAGPVDCLGVAGGSATIGSACNDNNSFTSGDMYNSNCLCVGSYAALATNGLTTALGDGTYTVSFNITGGNGVYGVNGVAISGATYTSASIPCGTSYSFTVSDGSGQAPITVSGASACIVDNCASLSALEVGYLCESNTWTYTYQISGGTAPYTVFGDFNGNDLVEGETITLSGPDGGNFTFTVTDLEGCTVTISRSNVQCVKCTFTIEMNEDEDIACPGESVSGTYTFTDVNEDFPQTGAFIYAIHTGSGSEAGTVLAANATGVFNFSDISGAQYGVTYYLSALAGEDGDGNGVPDYEDNPCVKVAPGVAVTFISPIVITAEYQVCDQDSGEQAVLYTLSGGMPPYSVSGDVNGTYNSNAQFTHLYSDGNTPTISVADASGCNPASYIGAAIACSKTDISLVSFTGKVEENANVLNWVTGSEYQNNFFTIARSTDGINFKSLATINGAGTSTSEKYYSYSDKNAPSGVAYYRLSQTDYDGSVTVVEELVVLVRDTHGLSVTSVIPNPTLGESLVSFHNPVNGLVEVRVFDVAGKLIQNKMINAINGLNSVNINLTDSARGVYFVTISSVETVVTTRLIKE